MNNIAMQIIFRFSVLLILLPLLFSCELPATSFEDIEDAVYYFKSQPIAAPQPESTIKVMTWNIRFGIGRGEWFGDACGSKAIYTEDEVLANLELIVKRINQVKPDILLLQEVDINSKRSGYVDQLKWIMDHTDFSYAVYGMQWQAQYIPSDGLGRLHEANAILSRWPIGPSSRIQLALRGDQDKLTRYFYERCCMVKAKIEIPGVSEFYAVNIHASAFATDDTKYKHFTAFKEELDNIADAGGWFVAGGDLNTLPPGSDSTDFCYEDICPGESFHQPGDDPQHKEGSNYAPEEEWLKPFYDEYKCAVPLNEYLKNQPAYFTHTTEPELTFNRTLDYMFTNSNWQSGSTVTHQDFFYESDHAPVSSKVVLFRK
jgi:endonuclease/exonuclease/phosphatase family metal-dependent hydrolase